MSKNQENYLSMAGPLTQADLDKMDFDKVWISYGPEPDNGEWALVYGGQLYSIDTLEGAGFEDMLRDLMAGGETLDNPSGAYRVYRFSLKELRNTLPESPLTIEQLLEMDRPVWCSCKPIEGGNGYWCLCKNGNIITPDGSIFNVKEIPHWVFYAHPHAHIDREAWVSVDDHLPPEHDSIFKKFKGTDKWVDGMFESLSDDAIVSVKFGDGTKKTYAAHTKDGIWSALPKVGHPVVTHWMPLPEPPDNLEK